MNRREGCSSASRDDSSTTSATAATPSSPSLDNVSARAPRPILRRTLVSATLVAPLRVDTPPESTSRASARVSGAPRALERVRIIPFARRALVSSSRRLVVPSSRRPVVSSSRRPVDSRNRAANHRPSRSPLHRVLRLTDVPDVSRSSTSRSPRARRAPRRALVTDAISDTGRSTSHRADATPTATSRDEDLEG